jgi:magnesium transporter
MIKSYTLKNTRVENIELDRINSKTMTLVHCFNPGPEEKEQIIKLLKITKEEFNEYIEDLKEDARPRIEHEQNFIFMLYKAPWYENKEEILTTPVAFFIKDNMLLILHDDPVKTITKIMNAIENKKASFLFKKGVGFMLYKFLDSINDEFLLITDKISDTSDLLKEKATKELTEKNIERIDDMNTTLIYFNRAILGNGEVITFLKKGYFRPFKKYDKELFHDLYIDVIQLIDTLKIQREVIHSFFNFQNAIASQRLNEFMKRVTVLALLIMVPTFISGLYGMNFKYIPLQNHPLGFFITIILMLVILVFLIIFLRRNKWL